MTATIAKPVTRPFAEARRKRSIIVDIEILG
jgi:hypothetical protein